MPLYLLKFYFSHSIFAVSSDSSQQKKRQKQLKTCTAQIIGIISEADHAP